MTPPDYRTRIIQTEQDGITVFYLPDISFCDPNTYPAHPKKYSQTKNKAMRRTASSNGPKPEQAFSCAAREESVSAQGEHRHRQTGRERRAPVREAAATTNSGKYDFWKDICRGGFNTP